MNLSTASNGKRNTRNNEDCSPTFTRAEEQQAWPEGCDGLWFAVNIYRKILRGGGWFKVYLFLNLILKMNNRATFRDNFESLNDGVQPLSSSLCSSPSHTHARVYIGSQSAISIESCLSLLWIHHQSLPACVLNSPNCISFFGEEHLSFLPSVPRCPCCLLLRLALWLFVFLSPPHLISKSLACLLNV